MAQPDLITLTEPYSPVSEAFRTLRTNLEFSGLDHPLRSLLVVAPAIEPGAAKTLANLAVIMAEGGRRVILVDGDMRRPTLHEIFGLRNDVGLSSLFANSTDNLTNLPLQAGTEHVQVLTSGPLPPNPSILLGSARMAAIIAALTAQADLVLFSAPPVIAVTDAALLAARVDGTLLILRARGTEREHARQAKALLEKVNARLVGAVLIDADRDNILKNYYK